MLYVLDYCTLLTRNGVSVGISLDFEFAVYKSIYPSIFYGSHTQYD